MDQKSLQPQQEHILEDLLAPPVEHAGFWLRFAAYIIDIMILFFAIMVIIVPAQYTMRPGQHSDMMEFVFLFAFFAILSYFPIMESSRMQATLGKRAVGIAVTDMFGNRISFGRALARFAAKFLSYIIFYIGFLMAGFTEKKQGLHDIIAQTLVIRVTGAR